MAHCNEKNHGMRGVRGTCSRFLCLKWESSVCSMLCLRTLKCSSSGLLSCFGRPSILSSCNSKLHSGFCLYVRSRVHCFISLVERHIVGTTCRNLQYCRAVALLLFSRHFHSLGCIVCYCCLWPTFLQPPLLANASKFAHTC